MVYRYNHVTSCSDLLDGFYKNLIKINFQVGPECGKIARFTIIAKGKIFLQVLRRLRELVLGSKSYFVSLNLSKLVTLEILLSCNS